MFHEGESLFCTYLMEGWWFCWSPAAGEAVVVGGNSWRVGLSIEYGRANGSTGSGSSVVDARCPPAENRMANDEAVAGKGFLRTGDDDDEVEEVEEKVSALDRIDNGGRPRELFRPCSVMPVP
jgi:hypothetical protein